MSYVDFDNIEHEEAPVKKLNELLTFDQLNLLDRWLLINELDKDTLMWGDDLLNGVRLRALDPKTDEYWEIDFVRQIK